MATERRIEAAMATAAALRLPAAASLGRKRVVAAAASRPMTRPLVAAAFSASSDGGGKGKQLVLYTKQGCCLCEGLKEKLETAFLLGGPRSLHAVQLQVRDISENPEWERLYQYEIPVLARVLPDGSEVRVESLPFEILSLFSLIRPRFQYSSISARHFLLRVDICRKFLEWHRQSVGSLLL